VDFFIYSASQGEKKTVQGAVDGDNREGGYENIEIANNLPGGEIHEDLDRSDRQKGQNQCDGQKNLEE
jgi:hypothetical protein